MNDGNYENQVNQSKHRDGWQLARWLVRRWIWNLPFRSPPPPPPPISAEPSRPKCDCVNVVNLNQVWGTEWGHVCHMMADTQWMNEQTNKKTHKYKKRNMKNRLAYTGSKHIFVTKNWRKNEIILSVAMSSA